IWIISHPYGKNYFMSYLLSASGLSMTPVTSTVGPNIVGSTNSCLKVAMNGRRLAWTHDNPDFFALLDFDPLSGQISNFVKLSDNAGSCCEFSPDGSKLYG